MCRISGLHGTASHRIATCRPQAWPLIPSAVRQRADLICSAQLQQHSQHWAPLPHSRQCIHTHAVQQHPSLLVLALQPSHWWPTASCLHQHRSKSSLGKASSRKSRRSARLRAAAHESETESPAGVTTVDKQQQHNSSSIQHVAAGSSEDFIQPAVSQQSSKPLYSPLHYDVIEFVRQVVPTAPERAEKQRIIQW